MQSTTKFRFSSPLLALSLFLFLSLSVSPSTSLPTPQQHHHSLRLRTRERVPYRKAEEEEVTQPPPKPFKYSYAAGRSPNGKPDRYVEQEGDGTGRITGSYAYLDPSWRWRKVEYVADPETGFHVVNEEPERNSPEDQEPEVRLPPAPQALPPLDTKEVAKAKERHRRLFAAIAARHRKGATAGPAAAAAAVDAAGNSSGETAAVQEKRREHAEAFRRIAEEHARIAAEHSRLTSLARQFGEIYD